MKIAIFGGGSIGTRHARNAQALGCAVVTFDPDPSRGYPMNEASIRRQLYGRLGVGAVLICTPLATHRTVAEELLAVGYKGPLFVEKVIDVTSDSPVFRNWPHPVTMVGYNLRKHPAIQAMRDMLRSELCGDPIHARFYTGSSIRTWHGAAYADALAECSHEIDLALYLLGPARCVAAQSAQRAGLWELLLRHDSGALSSVHLNYVQQDYYRAAHITTNLGTLGYTWDGGDTFEAVTSFSIGVKRSERAFDIEDTYLAELSEFLAAVREQRASAVPFEHGLAVVAIIDQARRLAA